MANCRQFQHTKKRDPHEMLSRFDELKSEIKIGKNREIRQQLIRNDFRIFYVDP
jgi:hypothetical protein